MENNNLDIYVLALKKSQSQKFMVTFTMYLYSIYMFAASNLSMCEFNTRK